MNTNTVIWVVVIILVVLGLGWWYLSSSSGGTTTTTGTPQTQTSPTGGLPGSTGASASGTVQTY